ncbi:MAG: WbqC family protein [Raineya sp.]|nr:WbqC family protein [Raineya sp.]
MCRVIITQSNYIPWKGYFDSINQVDVCVLYDEVQFTKRDWRNRNIIKTPQGTQWLTIPVKVKGNFYQKVQEVEISEKDWAKKHWKTLELNYKKAKCFHEIAPLLADFYQNTQHILLSEINVTLIRLICQILKIQTPIYFSNEFPVRQSGKNERLIDICLQLGATEYYTGASARNYLDEQLFAQHGITVKYWDYSGYPEYSQLYGNFVHEVSIVDLLFNEGFQAPKFMKSFSNEKILQPV